MIRKFGKGFVLLFVCWLLVCAGMSCSPAPEEVPELLSWDREASRMLDHEIDGDRIRLRYSVRLVSRDPDVDWKLSNFTLYFAPETVTGWLKYEESYLCTIEGGAYSVVIPGGETVDVVLILEGTYFHGEVPREDPPLMDLRYMMAVCGKDGLRE